MADGKSSIPTNVRRMFASGDEKYLKEGVGEPGQHWRTFVLWGSRRILTPGMSYFAPATKGPSGRAQFQCVDCRETLGVCSCFKPRYDHHG